jgi:hypothetical protein
MHFVASWVHAAGNFVNEFGFATTRPFGEAKVNHPEVPGITVLGIEGYQTGWGPNAFVQNNFEWRDVASFTRGSHNLKIGGNVTRGRADHESSRVYNRPQFVFNSVFDFATDAPNVEQQHGYPPQQALQPGSRRITLRICTRRLEACPNLTVNLGFRYEHFFNPSDGLGDQGVCNMAFPSSGGGLESKIPTGVMTCSKHLLNHTLNTFSPRVGFAWDPTKQGKISVRGGQAEGTFRRVLELAPNDASAYLQLGLLLESRGDSTQASSQFQKALHLAPGLTEAHLALGRMAKSAQDWTTAVREFEAVLAWNPENTQAHYDLATALKAGGHAEQAARELQIAMKLDPGIARPH